MVSIDKDKIKAGLEAVDTARAKTLRIMAKKGPSLTKILKRLNESLDAEITKFFSLEGEVTDERNITDNTTRLRAIDLALQIYDAMPSKKHDVKHTGAIGLRQLLDDIDGETTGPSKCEKCQKD